MARGEIVEPTAGVGYIQLIGFQKNSAEELDRAVTSLRRQGMRSLVLDLQQPGGLLNVAVEIAERFIDKGPIVFTRGRAPGQSQEYRARGRAAWTMPLCVLIDHERRQRAPRRGGSRTTAARSCSARRATARGRCRASSHPGPRPPA